MCWPTLAATVLGSDPGGGRQNLPPASTDTHSGCREPVRGLCRWASQQGGQAPPQPGGGERWAGTQT